MKNDDVWVVFYYSKEGVRFGDNGVMLMDIVREEDREKYIKMMESERLVMGRKDWKRSYKGWFKKGAEIWMERRSLWF